MSKITPDFLKQKKFEHKIITCLTAYDAPIASLIDAAGIDIVLVGDSVGNAVLGYENTLPVTLADMTHHLKAVRRAVKTSLLVCDMPLSSFSSEEAAINDAISLFKAGAEAVKIEGVSHLRAIKELSNKGIPVMGHLGFTPQSDGSPSVKGKTGEGFAELIRCAALLENAGVFAIVLELVERTAAQKLTGSVSVPTIGIGSGPHCDGQVLVINDVVGLTLGKVPKFAKQYADIKEVISSAVKKYKEEVENLKYPL
ncbi:MAG: 3-methyl-2-oxobutanoate hydroxymethyltransferase [Candidatus Margulisiibacteriota bacterium]